MARFESASEPLGSPNMLFPDPLFVDPYVDIDEWRDAPVRHRYVHGGFHGTDLRFSIYFPPADRYEGRFFQPLAPIAGGENGAIAEGWFAGMTGDSVPFAAASGAYLVESNMGSKLMLGPGDVVGFRANAAAAQYSRILAAQMYGPHRPYGYIYGGSGGAFKTFASVENTTGIWDGAAPFIHGSPLSLPSVITVQAHALRVLRDKIDRIVDAVDPGGSGDIYADLDAEERAALEEATRMGFPPRAWFAHERMAFHYTGILAQIILPLFRDDPGYFTDFWTVPGYLGADPPPSLAEARIRHRTTVTAKVSTAEARSLGLPLSITAGTRDTAPAAIRIAALPGKSLQGAFLYPRSGNAAGLRLMVADVFDDLVMLGFSGENIPALEAIAVGDEIEIDNSEYLAIQTYHRHQNPPAEYRVWDQFRSPDGKPLYPQRPMFEQYDQVGPGNAFQSGKFSCKIIAVNTMMDEAAFVWQADWYRKKVEAALGPRLEDQYRLWLVDHAMHRTPGAYGYRSEDEPVDDDRGRPHARIVSYSGILQQALRDLAAWAEHGVAPPRDTRYEVSDGQVHIPPDATGRRGVQPVVGLTANGKARADVKVGESVRLLGFAEVPPGAGVIVSAEWDYDGRGLYRDRDDFADMATQRTIERSHTFSVPGTYFVALRIGSQRENAIGSPFAKAMNLARVRIVVT